MLSLRDSYTKVNGITHFQIKTKEITYTQIKTTEITDKRFSKLK